MNFKKRNLFLFSLASVFLISLAFPNIRRTLKRAATGVSSTFVTLPGKVSSGVDNFKSGFRDSNDLQGELNQLKKELEQHRISNISNDALKKENEELRRMHNLKPYENCSVETAEVVLRNPISWNRLFRINKGRNSGLTVGQPVIHDGNLIGRIKEVFAESAIVVTLADPSCKVSARIRGESSHGVISGATAGDWYEKPVCKFQYLPKYDKLKNGMIVETSGYSELIPPGISIGTLIATKRERVGEVIDNLYQNVTAYPFADFKELRFVAVIIRK